MTEQSENIKQTKLSKTYSEGDVLSKRFAIKEQLGASEGGVSYFAVDNTSKREVVIKVLGVPKPGKQEIRELQEEVRKATKVKHKNILRVYGLGKDGKNIFMALEYADGETLAVFNKKNSLKPQGLSLRATSNIVSHLCNALIHLHKVTIHGALTPLNIYLLPNGQVRIANLCYSRWVSTLLMIDKVGAYIDSPYLSPEIKKSPATATESADVFSLGLLVAELHSRQLLMDFDSDWEAYLKKATNHLPQSFQDLIEEACHRNAKKRIQSVGLFKERYQEVIEKERPQFFEALEQPTRELSIDDLKRAVKEDQELAGFVSTAPSAVEEISPDDEVVDEIDEIDEELEDVDMESIEELMDIDDEFIEEIQPEIPLVPELPTSTKPHEKKEIFTPLKKSISARRRVQPLAERWLVSKNGKDYGPFTEEEVLEQLYKDEIHELSTILDMQTQELVPLQEIDQFQKKVFEYIPKRQERLAKEAAQRAVRQQHVKFAGKSGLTGGIIVALGVITVAIVTYFSLPDPQPILFEKGIRVYPYVFEIPKVEYTSIALEGGLMGDIFDFENPQKLEAKKKKAKSRRSKKNRHKNNEQWNDEEVETTFNMTGDDEGPSRILSDSEINSVIMEYSPGLQRCFRKEYKKNPGFKGVTLEFKIRNSGSTTKVKIKESKYADGDFRDCMVGVVRKMKFPSFDGTTRGVTLPFYR